MSAIYLDDFCDELRRLGDIVFKRAHRTPMLIVLGKTAELVEEAKNKSWNGKTVVATPSGELRHMALVNRVFIVEKAPHSPRGPIVVGRSDDTDVLIPEYSISKRHCFFDFLPEGIMVSDCGSTNGTFVGDLLLAPGEQALVRDGQTLSLGRFAFRFCTAPGFYTQVKSRLL
jgi:pSer/pThr/pTyr-binding forkhead associated (FHA) protein